MYISRRPAALSLIMPSNGSLLSFVFFDVFFFRSILFRCVVFGSLLFAPDSSFTAAGVQDASGVQEMNRLSAGRLSAYVEILIVAKRPGSRFAFPGNCDREPRTLKSESSGFGCRGEQKRRKQGSHYSRTNIRGVILVCPCLELNRKQGHKI
jgi:hypothetical protein